MSREVAGSLLFKKTQFPETTFIFAVSENVTRPGNHCRGVFIRFNRKSEEGGEAAAEAVGPVGDGETEGGLDEGLV